VKLYSIYDRKANVYNTPFPAPTPGIAERSIRDAMKQGGQLADYPEDFDLVEAGDWDSSTCSGTWNERPIVILNLTQLIERK